MQYHREVGLGLEKTVNNCLAHVTPSIFRANNGDWVVGDFGIYFYNGLILSGTSRGVGWICGALWLRRTSQPRTWLANCAPTWVPTGCREAVMRPSWKACSDWPVGVTVRKWRLHRRNRLLLQLLALPLWARVQRGRAPCLCPRETRAEEEAILPIRSAARATKGMFWTPLVSVQAAGFICWAVVLFGALDGWVALEFHLPVTCTRLILMHLCHSKSIVMFIDVICLLLA